MPSMDPKEGLRLSYDSAMDFLDNHSIAVDRFLSARVRPRDHGFVLRELLRDPIAFANTIKISFKYSESQTRQLVISKICKEGTVSIMMGAKGHGKTVCAFWIIEQTHLQYPDKKIYWFGYSDAIKKHYPYVIQTFDFLELQENFILIVDESAILVNSRNSMSKGNKEKMSHLPTIRHCGGAIIFITQSGKRIDITIFEMADIIWFKPFFVFDFDDRVPLPAYLKYMMPLEKEDNMVHELETGVNYVFKSGLPSIWNDALSKPYTPIKTNEEAVKYYDDLVKAGFKKEEIITMMIVRKVNPNRFGLYDKNWGKEDY
jgi:hypothetical protein